MGDPTHPAQGTDGSWTRLWLVLLLVATALGIWLRLDQFGAQVVADDEWHSLHAVRDQTLGWILTHFGVNDHCIPLTALDWILANTLGLSETGMRILPLAAGCLAIPLLALLLRREVGARASLLCALLLAISPIEISYSRSARPYEVVFLLAFVALLALRRWVLGGSRAWAWTYVAAAALAVWFHLVVAPFVLAPLAWCCWPGVAQVRGRTEVARLGVLAGFGMLLLVGPPLLCDFDALQRRAFGFATAWPDGEVCFQLLSGTFRPLAVFVFALALLLGFSALRHLRGIAGWLFCASAAQFLLLLLARPAVLEEAPVLVRYVLPVHGLVLVLAALGLERLDDLACAEFARLPRSLLAPLLVAALYVSGPLPWIHARPNNWTGHLVFQANYARTFPYDFVRSVYGLQLVPPVYGELAREARPGDVLLEAPWFAASQCAPFPIYQRSHHMPFLVGFVTPAGQPLPQGELRAQDARFRFANFVHVSEFAELAARHVRFVVFHRDRPLSLADEQHVDLRQVEPWIERYKQRFGPPRFDDGKLCVFDLAR
jgi:hypothetical protein